MTKKQKIWFWLSLAFFIVPELLWSPILNIVYQIFQTDKIGATSALRSNFLNNSDNLFWYKLILVVQFISLVNLYLNISSHWNYKKPIKYIILLALGLLAIFLLYIIYFVFNFSLGI